jgi:hypothetical protein
MNFHFDQPHSKNTKLISDLFEANGLSQHVSEPTHCKGHTLDVVITRQSEQFINEIQVTDPDLSDHYLITMTMNIPKPEPERKKVTYRKTKDIDIENFRSDIKAKMNAIRGENVSDLVSNYNSTLTELLDHHAPLQSKTIQLRPHAPWYTNELRESKQQRRKLERQWKKSKLTVHQDLYKQQCKLVNTQLNKTRTEYYSNKIAESSNDQKALYNITNTLLQKETTKPLPTHTSVGDLCEQFADFFNEKINKIRRNLEIQGSSDSSLTHSGPYRENILTELSTLRPATEEEVRKIIAKSKSTSCSLDPVPTWLLKECSECLLPVITKIVNMSLSTSEVSSKLKEALVGPLIKKALLDSDIFKNYRPVSNLSYISKIIEKIVSVRYNEHLMQNNLKEEMQSAYSKNHSTETALLKVQDDILLAIDDGKVVVLVLLDLSAAFDTIDHNIMLDRLESRNITGPALQWFRSYLTNRTQKVNINENQSQPKILEYGVPQGSVLGPQMYSDYTTPIGNIIRKYGLNLHIYADDTQLYASCCVQNAEELATTLQKLEHCIAEIKAWMVANKLQLNEDKTELIVLGSKIKLSQMGDISLNIGGQMIKPTKSVRNLGVIFDAEMDMKQHISTVCKNAYFQLRKISQIRKFLTEDATKTLVQSAVMSRLDYGNALLIGLPKTQLNRLQRVQNAAARLVKKIPKSSHITPVMQNLHWLPIHSRVQFKVLLNVFKGIHGQSPAYLMDLLNRYTPRRSLRSMNKHTLMVPRTKLRKYGDRAFSHIGPALWNSLPEHVKDATSTPSFKTLLKTHLFQNAYDC